MDLQHRPITGSHAPSEKSVPSGASTAWNVTCPYYHAFIHRRNPKHYYKAGDQSSSIELLDDLRFISVWSKKKNENILLSSNHWEWWTWENNKEGCCYFRFTTNPWIRTVALLNCRAVFHVRSPNSDAALFPSKIGRYVILMLSVFFPRICLNTSNRQSTDKQLYQQMIFSWSLTSFPGGIPKNRALETRSSWRSRYDQYSHVFWKPFDLQTKLGWLQGPLLRIIGWSFPCFMVPASDHSVKTRLKLIISNLDQS